MTTPTMRRPPAGAPAAPADGLMQGAVGWSSVYYDETGRQHRSRQRVQIDQFGQIAAVEYACPKCHLTRQFPPTLKKIPVCTADGRQMERSALKRPAVLPWRSLWDAFETPARPLAPFVVAAAVAAELHAADVSGVAVGAGGLALAFAVRKAAAVFLVKQATRRGRMVDGGSKGLRSLLARRARTVGYGVAAGGAWTAVATETGLDPFTPGGFAALLVGLPLTAAAVSAPWWLWLAQQRRRAPAPAKGPEVPTAEVVDPFELEVKSTWATRVGSSSGALPGTKLTGFKYIKGGWSAVVTSDTPGSIEPDRWRNATGRVAAAYRCGLTDVSLELDGGDASQSTVLVQKENPLCEVVLWPGPEATWDFKRGVSMVGRFGDNDPAWYRWWNEGGPWHDLISGCTGSGKSVLVNQLLLMELHSGGRVLSRVIDPQWGQSFKHLQDHVDWFAPNISEAQLLLLDTVKQMYRRNRLYSRRREDWAPGGDEPLIVVTIDEAHEVLKDPVCLELVERLAKMARKTGIKLRIITQVPVVTEIGNSTPIKDALLAGNIVVFRTGSAISSQVSIGATLPVDPHRLPAEWPKGSPGEGKTTAGLGFMAGASRREVPWRAFYNGDAKTLKQWLELPDGTPITNPGRPSEAMVTESGFVWNERHDRVRLLFEQPPSNDDILPAGLVDALMAAARVRSGVTRSVGLQPPTDAPAPAPDDGTSRAEVVRVAVRLADGNGRVEKIAIQAVAKKADGVPMPPGTLSGVLTKLVSDRTLTRIRNGLYEVTDRARNEVGDEAEALVDAMIGPEPVEASA